MLKKKRRWFPPTPKFIEPDFLSLISKQVGKKERSIENLTNDLKYGGYGEEDRLEMTELLFREQTILENLTEVIAATKEKLAVYEAYEKKKQ